MIYEMMINLGCNLCFVLSIYYTRLQIKLIGYRVGSCEGFKEESARQKKIRKIYKIRKCSTQIKYCLIMVNKLWVGNIIRVYVQRTVRNVVINVTKVIKTF
jgi:hypothetical protein